MEMDGDDMREFFREKNNEKSYVIIIFILLCYNMLSIDIYLYLNLKDNEAQASEIEYKIDKPINEGIVEKPLRYKAIDEDKVFVEEAYKSDGKKTAYLTFDDGPSNYVTPVILDILDKYNIKATFFVVGNMALENKEILKDEYRRGHSIGSHSYDHDYKKIYGSEDGFREEDKKSFQTIKDILGANFETRLFRFPGGSFENSKNRFKEILQEEGKVYVDWNALNGDGEGHGFSEEYLFNRFKETAGSKDKIVILMHDTNAKENTAKGLEKIIIYLKSEGYEFKALK